MRSTKRQIIAYFLVFAMIVSCLIVGTTTLTAKAADVPNVTVSYRTHVQTYGWQNWKSDGSMAGTSGESKRLEGININVTGNSNLGIQYTTHVQTYGWMPWSRNGEMSGTSGESKRLEAIKIQLIGKDKDKYDVYYRVHAQHYGWMGWAKNGQAAGTAGFAYRLEGINIVIVKKGATFDGTKYEGGKCWIDTPYVEKTTSKTDVTVSGANTATVMYQTHVQTYGWQAWKKNGELGGTTEDKRLEAIKIQLTNKPYSGGITYQLHVQSYGWQDWVSDGTVGGTFGEAKRVEGIKIKLTGNMAKYYDVTYRAYIESIGWQDWKSNGEMAGTSGRSLKLEGFEIKLVKKAIEKPTEETTTEETTEKPDTTEDTSEETHTHKYTAKITKKATCTTDGVKTYICSCGDSYTEKIKATGHNLTEHKAVAATCTKAGNTAYWSCSNCGKYFSDSKGKTEIAKNSWVVKATGHKYTSKVTKEPTYEETGIRTYTCSKCGHTYTETIDKLVDPIEETCNHNWSNITTEKTKVNETTVNTTTKGYYCPSCNMVIYNKTIADYHKDTHTINTVYKKQKQITYNVAYSHTCTKCGESEVYKNETVTENVGDPYFENDVPHVQEGVDKISLTYSPIQKSISECVERGEYWDLLDRHFKLAWTSYVEGKGKYELHRNNLIECVLLSCENGSNFMSTGHYYDSYEKDPVYEYTDWNKIENTETVEVLLTWYKTADGTKKYLETTSVEDYLETVPQYSAKRSQYVDDETAKFSGGELNDTQVINDYMVKNY